MDLPRQILCTCTWSCCLWLYIIVFRRERALLSLHIYIHVLFVVNRVSCVYVQRMASSCYCTVCVTAIVILKLDITCTCNTCGIRLHVHVLSIIIASSLVYKSSGLVITLMGTVHTHINSNYTHYVCSDTLLTCTMYTVYSIIICLYFCHVCGIQSICTTKK